MRLDEIPSRFERAHRRLLLLDYDGVLAPIVAHPEDAAPTPEIISILKNLSKNPYITVVVISGRPHDVLERWLGDLPIEFVAEHGVWRRDASGQWHMTIKPDEVQINAASRLLEEWVHQNTNTYIEQKRVGVAFHYRQSPTLRDADVSQLIAQNREFFLQHDLTAIHGKKVVELIPRGVDKGSAARYWLDHPSSSWDFVLAAGDDTTDEALFAVLKPNDISIHVGAGPTAARLQIRTQPEFREFLAQLTAVI